MCWNPFGKSEKASYIAIDLCGSCDAFWIGLTACVSCPDLSSREVIKAECENVVARMPNASGD
jgi:hypothetical protein